MTLIARLREWRSRLDDSVRYNPLPQGILCLVHWALAASCPANKARWLSLACSGARYAPTTALMRAIERWMMQRLDGLSVDVLWSWQPAATARVEVAKAAILKPSAPDEKGVVFVSFESQWEKLLAMGPLRLAEFAAEYDLVLAPTWSPPHSPVNMVFPRLYPGSLLCTISNLVDLEIFPRLHPSYKPVELFASSWVNPEIYRPRPRSERDIDLVMVANFGRYKRHSALFAALRGIPKNKRPRVVLVGQPHGERTVDVLKMEMDDHGVSDCITLRSRISDAEVVDILCRSKAALITSLREGSCVAVVEAMMADVPVALLRGAHIGSSAFLNEKTGRWLDGSRLHEELLAFIADSGRFSPRSWLSENGVHCLESTRKLNQQLSAEAQAAGKSWTTDIFPHHWRPDPLLIDPEDVKVAVKESARLEAKFGLKIPITTT